MRDFDVLEFEYYGELFEIYKNLLTDKQREIVKDYYIYNLSLQEISESQNITKSAVGDALTNALKKLDKFEKALKISEKNHKLKEIVDKSNLTKEEKEKINEVL